jgi:hypothetical protein
MRLERLRRDNWAPLGALVALVAGVGWILLNSVHQWFFYDEWAFLVPRNDGDLFEPHAGHWSTLPMLITQFLRDTIGMGDFWPYLLFAIAAHVGISLALWVIMRRVGVQPWVAVSLFFLFLVLGIGAENILWEFQVGFMGAVALGLLVVLLVDDERRRLPIGKAIAAVLVSILSLTFSGTSLPVVLAGFLVSWRRRGFLRSLLLFAPTAVVYGVWYLITSRIYPAPGGSASEFTQFTVGIPKYVGHMYVDGLTKLTPIPALGVLIVIALLLFVATRVPALWATQVTALALACAGLAFALLTGYTRFSGGTHYASSSRYVYLVVCYLIPVIGLAVTWAIGRRVQLLTVSLVLILGVAAYNAAILRQAAGNQAKIEQNTKDIVYAAIDVLQKAPNTFPGDSWPEPIWAPDMHTSDLEQMVAKGYIKAGPHSPQATMTALLNMGVQVTQPSQSSRSCSPVQGTVVIGKDTTLESSDLTKIDAVFEKDGVQSESRTLDMQPGYNTIHFGDARSQVDGQLQLTLPGSVDFKLCR